MRLAYITNVKIPAEDAQSLQITAMARVFGEKLGKEFLLVSPKNKQNQNLMKDFNWQRLGIAYFLSRGIRYIFTILFSLPVVLKFKPQAIYSRDIGVVLFYHLFGYSTVYEIHKPFETFWGEKIFRLIAKRIKIVAISAALREYILEKYTIQGNSILVAHDGVFMDGFINLNKEECRNKLFSFCPDLPKNKLIALYSGNLKVGGKGVDLIIQAAKSLLNVSFVVVGGHTTGLQLPPNIFFIERQLPDIIPLLLKGADILLLPFTKELKTWKYHSALKMFEYMAANVPVVVSDLGSIKEVFNNENATLFNVDDLNDMTKKLRSVVDNYVQASNKSAVAFQQAKKYDWANRTEAILSFLKSC